MENTKNKRKIGLWLAFLFAALVLFVIIYLVISYQNDQNEAKKRMNEVVTSYETFKEHIASFNKKRETVYQEAMQNMYYTTLKENDSRYKELFADYENALALLDNDYKKLKGKCIDVLYPDVSVNNKCEAFVLGYEEAMNTFVSDVESYNQNINAYNTWLKESDKSEEPLVKVKTSRSYLDLDGNREYRGKEVTKSTLGENKDEQGS